MRPDSQDVRTLVATLRRHFEQGATRADVRAAVHDACLSMHGAGVPPQTMLVVLKAAVQSAASDSSVIVSRELLRSTNSDLTPWMIDVCFSPASQQARG